MRKLNKRVGVRIAAVMLAMLAVSWASANAQPLSTGDSGARPAEAPVDPMGRSTPAGTINGFIAAIASQDYELASRYLDLSGIVLRNRATLGPVLAKHLQRALDREGRILAGSHLSDDPAGNVKDNPDADLETVGSIGAGEKAVAVILRRVEREGERYWLISQETLDAASAVREDAKGALAERWLPAIVGGVAVAGAPISHWLTLIAATLVAFALAWACLRLLLLVLRRIGWDRSRLNHFLTAIYRPLALFVALLAANLTAPSFGVSIVARHAYIWLLEMISPFVFGWLMLRLVDAVSDRILEGFGHRSLGTATSIVRFVGRITKALVIAIALLAIFDAFGFNVTAVLAALGIGGLALALGAQRTVENLIASVLIISDRPFRVGDFCKIGDIQGTVVDIGMRSTRVRTLARTVVAIPNSTLVSSDIENYAARDRFLFNPTLHISTTTPPEKLRGLLASLRSALDGDSRLVDRNARVRLLSPASDRLPIEIFGYVLAADFDDFLGVQEELTLKLLDAVSAEGLMLAPSPVELRRSPPQATDPDL